MRRFAVAFVAVPFVLLLAIGPVAADTSPNGTNFFSSSSSCSTTGGRQVCTDMYLNVSSNEDGSDGPPCLEIYKYSISSNGRFTFISDEFGCASSGTIAIGADLSGDRPSLDATPIPLDELRPAHLHDRRGPSPCRRATARPGRSRRRPPAPRPSPVGCTTRTTTTDQFADLAGTHDDRRHDVFDQTGSVDVFTSTSATHCRYQPQLLIPEVVGERSELRRLTANLGEVTRVQCVQDQEEGELSASLEHIGRRTSISVRPTSRVPWQLGRERPRLAPPYGELGRAHRSP